jgi:hypothetical protein
MFNLIGIKREEAQSYDDRKDNQSHPIIADETIDSCKQISEWSGDKAKHCIQIISSVILMDRIRPG